MVAYFPLALRAFLLTGLRLLRAVPAEGWRHAWKRLPLFILLWLLFVCLGLLHGLGFLLDELLFPAYRRVGVRAPVFILGIPRSGTTFLHRVMAADPRFASFSTWEVLFAPSITERYFWRLAGRLLAPLGRLFGPLRRRLLARMDGIHELGLGRPEEDFLLLCWTGACFLLAFLCPDCEACWRLARFDHALPEKERRRQLAYYRRCLQKHLYFHGPDRRFLSKNPSFTACIRSLREDFPDARFIACVRDPTEVVPSQLSSLRPAMALLGGGSLKPAVQARLIETLHHYYAVLERESRGPGFAILAMPALQEELEASVSRLYDFLDEDLSPAFREILAQLGAEARRYRSRHRYGAADFALDEAELAARFRDVWPPRRAGGPEAA